MKDNKPFYYLVLITSIIEEAHLIAFIDRLKSKLPIYGPSSGTWKRQIAHGVMVFNLQTWNETFPQYPVKRTGSSGGP